MSSYEKGKLQRQETMAHHGAYIIDRIVSERHHARFFCCIHCSHAPIVLFVKSKLGTEGDYFTVSSSSSPHTVRVMPYY